VPICVFRVIRGQQRSPQTTQITRISTSSAIPFGCGFAALRFPRDLRAAWRAGEKQNSKPVFQDARRNRNLGLVWRDRVDCWRETLVRPNYNETIKL
jgi:hypothetical protein